MSAALLEKVAPGQAGLLTGVDEGQVEGVDGAELSMHAAEDSIPGRCRCRRTPAAGAETLPAIQVCVGGAEGDTAVVGAAAPQDSRPGMPYAAVAPGLRLDDVVPVEIGAEQLRPAPHIENAVVTLVHGACLE